MTRYIVRRLLQALPLLWLISMVVFTLLHIIPGGPMAAYENNPDITKEDLARLEAVAVGGDCVAEPGDGLGRVADDGGAGGIEQRIERMPHPLTGS